MSDPSDEEMCDGLLPIGKSNHYQCNNTVKIQKLLQMAYKSIRFDKVAPGQ